MPNWFEHVRGSGVEYNVISINIGGMTQYIQKWLKDKYPDSLIDYVKIQPPESISESDSPTLSLDFVGDMPDGIEECYDGLELAKFLTERLSKEVEFCTARGEYMDLWFSV